ncbi:hypothetical protein ABGT15_11575 [Flavobacterium enshiense]|uniref:hypothetical protein n=1 Tax=Flavobacterium enshiense TaxID=1341165 RepID=UPI00345DE653
MRNFVIYLILFLFFSNHSHSQINGLKLIGNEKLNSGFFIGRDTYGAVYSIQNNEFRKQDTQQQANYKNITLGNLHEVDLQNPLQIVLFYKEMNSVVLLDRQLNETYRFNFSETNPELLPQQVRLASQNRLWIFDLTSQKLGLYDYQKKVFRPITVAFEHPIVYAQSDYNYFYWMDNKYDLFVSNLFGKINYLGKVPEHDALQIVSSKEILLKKGNVLSLFNLEKETSQIIPVKEKSFKNFYYSEQNLSIFTDNEIRTYKITLP